MFHDNKKLRFIMEKLVKRLIQKKLKISFAESCTGGMLASSITSISGASKVFNMGLITYSNLAKIKLLKVNKNIISKYGAVSAECCEAMVKNLAKISKAQINVSVTGIAGPNGGTKTKPVGLVYCAWALPDKGVVSRRQIFEGDREQIRLQTAEFVLLELANLLHA